MISNSRPFGTGALGGMLDTQFDTVVNVARLQTSY